MNNPNHQSQLTICKLIQLQEQKNPQRVAIIDGEIEINFSGLLAKSNAITAELMAGGIKPGALIGVCMHRSWEMVAALLGVLQAGCAYVPLDPNYPQERIDYMLEHSRAVAAIVDAQETAAKCKGVTQQLLMSEIGQDGDISKLDGPSLTDLAYVIYTSGTTGQPKGVAVGHDNLLALSQAIDELLSEEELKGVLAATSICFDISVMEILGMLSLGGTVILAQNALELPHLPAADKIRTAVIVPSTMQPLVSADELPKGLRCVVFGGEALKPALVEQLYQAKPDIRVINAYGPTEDTVFSTTKALTANTKLITIGQSISDSNAYILNQDLQPVATGVAGELHLAGNKLARGYLYDQALTDKRFISLEIEPGKGKQRLYKTGDLCRWTPDGEIEFIDRIDQQVKIRGFRIELEEIEKALECMTGVQAAAAAAHDSGMAHKILVVYVVGKDQTLTDEAVKSFLAQRLPQHMVPQTVVHLDTLPLSPSGKLDRKQLPKPELAPAQTPTSSNHNMDILAIIQREVAVLHNIADPNQVLPSRSFDEIGLDSLTGLELSNRLSKVLGQKLAVKVIIEHGNAAALSHYINHHMGNELAQNSKPQGREKRANTLASFQTHVQSSHPSFQAAKANAWSATDKGKLVQQVVTMVNNQKRNPYAKVLRTGSASRGTVADAYTDEVRDAVIWTTNLYLGMNRDEQVIEQAGMALQRFGTGMGTSAAASGMTDQHLQFERAFAELTGKPAACLFPTGYTANVGAVAGLLGENDVVIIDQLCHASIVDGAHLCGATVRTFKHNSPEDLEAVLKSEVSPYRTVLVVIEGVYSMGEGAAPVAEIVRKAKQYDALVLVDEAHSFGFYGDNGAGICAAQGVSEEVDFIMTTLSKSLGSLGGVISASKEHIELLKSSSRAYIFQASVSPADIAAALTALRRLSEDDSLRERLWSTTRYMRAQFEAAGYDLGSGDGPIVTPHFANKDKLYAIVQGMYKRGVQTSAVTYPIVESGRGRLRFICSASHTRADVDKTLAALIAADREADELLSQAQSQRCGLSLPISTLVAWANDFGAYLQTWVSQAKGAAPELLITISQANDSAAVELSLKQGKISVGEPSPLDLPRCSIHLLDDQAVQALTDTHVQALLQSICDGSCELNGQVEPFVWFVARMLERD